MSTTTESLAAAPSASAATISQYAVLAGRALFSAIFIVSGFTHFAPQMAQYATQLGVPFAPVLVPLSGLMAFAGGLSILLGYRARVGAALVILFLLPVTFMIHAFWNVTDPMMAQVDQAMFFKNLSMLGGALLIVHFGAGPLSLDARRSSQED